MKKINSGITLIALIITIIVLLILAGVAVSISLNSDSIFNKADSAAKENNKKVIEEQIEISNVLKILNDIAMTTVTTPPTTAVSEKTKYKDRNNDIAVIPEGFRVSDDTDEQTIDTGLVVYDGDDNDWVWIPVNNADDMIRTDGAPYTLSGDTGVITPIASKSEIISGIERTKPGYSSIYYFKREPDLILGSSGSMYDKSAFSTAGFESVYDFAQYMVDDYARMISSIRKYKGFYIGRYELTGVSNNPKEVSGRESIF